ncbi:MAG: hypothetical protein K0R54_1728 [Clostridiaceae bacterium]|jgi:hypothetical protein|nr:hypothetical protein [Clostridiaceae bacterium]
MVLNNNKEMLIFGFEQEEREILDKIIKKNALPKYKIITESMGKMTLWDIIRGLKLEVFNVNLPKEKVILFNNFSDEEVDKSISELKKFFTPMPIMAVITATSIKWTFEYLLQHLMEERSWYLKNRK